MDLFPRRRRRRCRRLSVVRLKMKSNDECDDEEEEEKRRTAHFLTKTYQILSFIIYADVYCHLYVCMLFDTHWVYAKGYYFFFVFVVSNIYNSLIKLAIYLLLLIFFALTRDSKPNYSILHTHAHTFKSSHFIISKNILRNDK